MRENDMKCNSIRLKMHHIYIFLWVRNDQISKISKESSHWFTLMFEKCSAKSYWKRESRATSLNRGAHIKLVLWEYGFWFSFFPLKPINSDNWPDAERRTSLLLIHQTVRAVTNCTPVHTYRNIFGKTNSERNRQSCIEYVFVSNTKKRSTVKALFDRSVLKWSTTSPGDWDQR